MCISRMFQENADHACLHPAAIACLSYSSQAEQTKHSLLGADLSPVHGAVTNPTSNLDNLDFHRQCSVCTSSAEGSLPQSDCTHADCFDLLEPEAILL